MTSTSSPTRKLAMLLGSATLVATSFLLTTPRTASALPARNCFCSFYDGDTQVGELDVFCNGRVDRWGTQTGTEVCDCCDCDAC
jgi:hypothetical protein